MRLLLSILFLSTLTIACSNGNSDNEVYIGKYKKEPLPEHFSYKIIEDKSNEILDKNQLSLEISQKISIGQLATLASKLYKSKPKRKRFYMFYFLPGMKKNAGAWAITHFDPDLKIEILGTSSGDDTKNELKANKRINGEVIGKWKEEQYTASYYIIYKRNHKYFLRTISKTGQVFDEELSRQVKDKGIKFVYKQGGYNGEYFVINRQGNLDLYNKEGNKFTTARKILIQN